MSQNQNPQPVQNLHGASPQPFDRGATFTPSKPGKLLRLPAVQERTGFGKSSIYAAVKSGKFPAPYRLSARAVAWKSEDVDRWICERVKVGAA